MTGDRDAPGDRSIGSPATKDRATKEHGTEDPGTGRSIAVAEQRRATTYPHHVDAALALLRDRNYFDETLMANRPVEWWKTHVARLPLPPIFNEVIEKLSRKSDDGYVDFVRLAYDRGEYRGEYDFIEGFRRFRLLLSGYQLGLAGKLTYAAAFFEDLAQSMPPKPAKHVVLFAGFTPTGGTLADFLAQPPNDGRWRGKWSVLPDTALGRIFEKPIVDTRWGDTPDEHDDRAYEKAYKILFQQISIQWVQLCAEKAAAVFRAVVGGTDVDESILLETELPTLKDLGYLPTPQEPPTPPSRPEPPSLSLYSAWREGGRWQAKHFPTWEEAVEYLRGRE